MTVEISDVYLGGFPAVMTAHLSTANPLLPLTVDSFVEPVWDGYQPSLVIFDESLSDELGFDFYVGEIEFTNNSPLDQQPRGVYIVAQLLGKFQLCAFIPLPSNGRQVIRSGAQVLWRIKLFSWQIPI